LPSRKPGREAREGWGCGVVALVVMLQRRRRGPGRVLMTLVD
jgi:hypothetical protein